MAVPKRMIEAVAAAPRGVVEERESVTIRFAGDSGDGMQLVGAQLSKTSAFLGNDVRTMPDLPAEIRAPAGSLAGVSGFQIHFSSVDIHTPGDRLDALVAMNPAALKTHLDDLEPDGLLLVNEDAFEAAELAKAGYDKNPLEDGSLACYRVLAVPMGMLNRAALVELKLTPREADRCKNFFALGLVYWLFDRSLELTLEWIQAKFAKNPAVLEANTRSLRAGYHYGETMEALPVHYRVPAAPVRPGRYRRITGNEGLALGMVAAAKTARIPLLYAGYPITPASDLLHLLAGWQRFGVRAFQAEDEMAAVSAALGAAFGGALGVTATSGPGVSLKSEGLGLAVMAELPLVVINIQRAGPSTGMPTKTEQADLLQALFGRNGECPAIVLAPASPGDCFAMMFEAARLALGYMTPVVLLSDAYLAQVAEPWPVPKPEELPALTARLAEGPNAMKDGQPRFLPYQRDERGVRPWAIPGTPGLEHRLGGMEKEDGSGDVSYEPLNRERMVHARAAKIARVAEDIPPLTVHGPDKGALLVLGWGGTFGAIRTAVERAQRKGLSVAHAHLRYLNPFPANTENLLRRYRKVLVPELNGGQLRFLLRGEFLLDVVGLSKVQGRPFTVREIEEAIDAQLIAD